MKVLVTGGGGFLGTQIIKELRRAEHDIYSLSRSRYPHLETLGVSQIQADLAKASSLDTIVKDFDVVIHTAAKAGVWGRADEFYSINFLGTKNLVDACIRTGVENFVYTSTPSVVSSDEDILGSDEQLSYPAKFYSEYAKSKAQAEKYVLSRSSNQFRACAIRPHLIWGEGDPHILPRLVDRARKNKLKIIGDGNNLVDIVHVENAAHLHVLAMKGLCEKAQGVNGEAFFIGQNEPVNLWKFINTLLDTQGIAPINSKVSAKLAYTLGYVLEKIYRVFSIYDRDPLMTRFVALQMSKSHYFSHDKAITFLGYQQRVSTEDGLHRLKKI